MEYALIYDKNNNQYHIYKSSNKIDICEIKEYIIHNNKIYFNETAIRGELKKENIYPHFIDVKLNKYPLCKEDIRMNDLNELEKHKITFTPEEYNINIYNPNEYYYLISKFRDKGKEYPSVYAKRKVIMIFSSLFQSENEMCQKCFLEFINELKNKQNNLN